ncbi:BTAD domain-containing putative transcriptional regulator [Clostridium sp. AM58-1XD]|uniref:AfsR/SARP family transcriptional regulator n=1 Tax=Clostridium sp. AM58-1XD TaxID=2292307 RepID=UPI000E55499C|nr:BTAD domain-containing putative transcriptional regulator [Clostridium sp. AM58-1XD]RGZ01543.1 hypothetical protein DXA13_01520 [Clostridium sp. AM58-1XD]
MSDNKIISVNMLGNLSVRYGDKPILLKCSKESRYMQMFLMLLYYNRKGITRKEMMENLYEEKTGSVDNAMRIVVYRLRKLIGESTLPKGEYIRMDGNRYFLTKEMEVELDTERFLELLQTAYESVDEEEKIKILKEACDIYKGDFLREHLGETWVEIENGRYQKIYLEAARKLTDFLKAKGRYDELLEFGVKNSRLFPFDDWQFVRIEALLAEGKKKEAACVYEDTLKLFQDEFGVGLPDDVIKKFEKASNQIFDEQDPKILIESVIKKEEDEGGAYYCNYLSFMDCCHVMKRMSERAKNILTMLVCYVVDENGKMIVPEAGEEAGSSVLKQAIRLSLRKEDVYTKYGMGTFMILMMGITKDDDCMKVFHRIEKNFNKIKHNRKLRIQYKVYPINW